MWHFGRWIQFSRIIKRSQKPLEKLLINGIFGVEITGYFQVAEKIPNIVISLYEGVVNKVLFPVRSKSAKSPYLISKITHPVALILLLGTGILFYFREYLILIAFNQSWLGVAPLMGVFLVFMPIVIIRSTYSIWWRATAKPSLEFYTSLMSISFIVFAFVFQRFLDFDNLHIALFIAYFIEQIGFLAIVYFWYQSNRLSNISPYLLMSLNTLVVLFTGITATSIILLFFIIIPIIFLPRKLKKTRAIS
tara:strand:- start:713 stop:1459 length:747 start_codon:yes stop_codon:yes gene_type:complete